jgi:hypothetical protein
MLGWDVGTFEFRSQRILAVGYNHHPKIKLRTGGSTGKLSRTAAHKLQEGDGYYWDLEEGNGKHSVRLPVKYRYRSPIVFEFHISNHRKADAYAVIWLQHFVDNEDADINIPIWKTAASARLTQNYITEANCHKEPGLEDLQEVGRLQFRARFKAGTDETHATFITDNDTRETYETWEACVTEGVRNHKVEKEIPDRVQELHDQSLTKGRDILKNASEEEKRKWLAKDGQDWSGAFGENPKAYMNTKRQKRREPGAEEPLHDRHHPSDNEDNDDSDDDYDDSNSSSDLGVQDADTVGNAQAMSGGPGGGDQSKGNGELKSQKTDLSPTADHHARQSMSTVRTSNTAETDDTSSSSGVNKQNKRAEERRHRGLMQWKPARNAKFAKDEAKIGLAKLKKKVTGGLDGRQPGVETGKLYMTVLGKTRILTRQQKPDKYVNECTTTRRVCAY